MSAEKYSEYVNQIEKAASDYVRGEILLKAARDMDLSMIEFVQLNHWARRWMKEQKEKKGRK